MANFIMFIFLMKLALFVTLRLTWLWLYTGTPSTDTQEFILGPEHVRALGNQCQYFLLATITEVAFVDGNRQTKLLALGINLVLTSHAAGDFGTLYPLYRTCVQEVYRRLSGKISEEVQHPGPNQDTIDISLTRNDNPANTSATVVLVEEVRCDSDIPFTKPGELDQDLSDQNGQNGPNSTLKYRPCV
jgi:hypothetical protein